MAFLLVAVTLDMDIVNLDTLSFGSRGASTLAPWQPFRLLGGSLVDHRSSRKDMWGVRTT